MKNQFLQTIHIFITCLLFIQLPFSFAQSSIDDPTWNPGEAGLLGAGFHGSGGIFTANRHNDGRLLVGGAFQNYNGVSDPRLVRLQADGSRDATFNIGVGFAGNWATETGIPAGVIPLEVVILPDNSYLVAGNFRTYQGITKGCLVKILANGNIDPDFNKDGIGAANGPVTSIMPVRDGKFVIGGAFTAYNGTSITRIARINADGTLDATFNSGGSGANLAVFDLDTLANGNVVAVGSFTTFNGSAASRMVQLGQDGKPVNFTTPIAGFNTGIRRVKVQQPGNKILIGGGFTSYNSTPRNRILRFNDNGTLDDTFQPGTGVLDGQINSIEFDSEGRILLGGTFTQINGNAAKRFARLSTNGSVDPTFNPSGFGPNSYNFSGTVEVAIPIGTNRVFIGGSFREYELCAYLSGMQVLENGFPDPAFNIATGAAGGSGWQRPGVVNASDFISPRVLAMRTTQDGKIYVGGEFTRWGAYPRRFLARLNSDGSVDPSFLANGFAAPNYAIWSIDVQPDGKVLIAGDFLSYGGVERPNVARLHADGTLDESFFPLNAFNGRASDPRVVKVLTNGKILVGGGFNAFNLDNTKRKLVRLNSDGTIDNTFTPPLFNNNGSINHLFIQPDGKIIVGSSAITFPEYNNNATNAGLFRLNADGSFDPSFNNGTFTNIEVKGLSMATNGKIYVTGGLSMNYGGQTRRGIFRINADGTPDNTFLGPQQTGTWDFVAAYDLPTGGVAAAGVYQALPQGSAFNISASGVAVLNSNGTANLPFLATGHRLTGYGIFNQNNANQLGIIIAAANTPQGILLGGDFGRSNLLPRINMTRMLPGDITTPVTWQSFTAQPTDGAVQLRWVTATEQNNKGFYIERSANGLDFQEMGFVVSNGNGNSTLPNHYQFADAKPLAGVSFYRLKQIDFDGTYAYSAVRKVVLGYGGKTKVFPNPVPQVFQITPAQSGRIVLQFTDAAGRTLGSQIVEGQQGAAMQVRRPHLPPGMYVLKIVYSRGGEEVIRIMIP